MHSENDDEGSGRKETFTGRDVLYREGAVGVFDVERAADALLRQGRKPSVAAIREQLGGGSPNTITPLLAKYWEKLGSRLGDGPESLERVPEALARVTELLWRRAIEEARERLKILQQPDHKPGAVEELQEQIGKLSVALAETRAREAEQLSYLAGMSKELETARIERKSMLALLKGAQVLSQRRAGRSLPNNPRSTPNRRGRATNLQVRSRPLRKVRRKSERPAGKAKPKAKRRRTSGPRR